MNKEFICENCGKSHSGEYASGRFCCRSCAKAYPSKVNKSKGEKISKSLKKHYSTRPRTVIKVCEICGRKFEVKIRCKRRTCSEECLKTLRSKTSYFSNISSELKSQLIKKSYEIGKNYVAGGTTDWIEYNGIKVQGTYELRACKILDKMKCLGEILNWEYTNDRIRYTWKSDGSIHNYLLDFKVYLLDNSFYYLEVKGMIREHDYEKWEAAKNQGYNHVVWFSNELYNHEKRLGLLEES